MRLSVSCFLVVGWYATISFEGCVEAVSIMMCIVISVAGGYALKLDGNVVGS